ncbi:MAG: hypothetical protein ABR525_07055 [Candidatus Limnocylindria bacterium]
MAGEADWDLNLFHSDPALLEVAPDADYERAAETFAVLADPQRLRLLHALCVGENTAQRAAIWAGLPQAYAERELASMALGGFVRRRDGPRGPTYAPRDGHLIVALHVTLAHGREDPAEQHPLLLPRRRRATSRAG